eukprot:jgi/Chrzof1/1623/Cz10g14280.t1
MANSGAPVPPAVSTYIDSKLRNFNFAFVVSDCSKPDMPICYASSQFYELTGYTAAEIIGKNCRFLQGPETEKRKVMEIRDAIREDRPCQVRLLNYKKNGQKFWNQFHLAPICDGHGQVTHYIGIQSDVTAMVESSHAAPSTPEIAEADNLSSSGQQTDEGQQTDSDQEEGMSAVVQLEQQEAKEVQGAMQQEGPSSSCPLPCSLLQVLMKIQQSFVLADPRLPDMPIVHASEDFLRLTGYSR